MSTQSTVQAMRRQYPDQTYVKTLTSSPQRQHASSHVTRNNVAIRNSRHTGEGITEASTSTGFSVTFGTGDESTQRKTTYNVDDIEKSSDTLRGFIQVTRPHNAPFFLSSVLMKDDSEESIEETINDIYKHMKRKGCTVKSVRKIKQYGNVLSVKIVGIQSDSDKVLDENFWPIGIRCRKWTN